MKFEPVTNKYAIWFGRFVWLGIIVNFCFVIAGLLVPQRLLAFMNLDPTSTVIWVQFSVYLLALLSLFYIPAAINPYRYRPNAYLAVFARIAGTVFFWAAVLFCGYDSAYSIPGFIDFVFAVPQGILLFLAFRNEKWA